MTSTTQHLGQDGTPIEQAPTVIADWLSRMADELAATLTHVSHLLDNQDATLAGVTTEGEDAARIDAARLVARRSRRALALVIDCLGEAHVTADELAWHLHEHPRAA